MVNAVTFLNYNDKTIVPNGIIGKILLSKSDIVFPVVESLINQVKREGIVESFNNENSSLVEISFGVSKGKYEYNDYYKLIKDSYCNDFNKEKTIAAVIFYAAMSIDELMDRCGRFKKLMLVYFVAMSLELNGFNIDNLFFQRIVDIDFNSNQTNLSQLLKDYTFNRKISDL